MIITSALDFLMTDFANGNLLAVDRSENPIEPGRFPLVGELADLSNVMYDDLPAVSPQMQHGFPSMDRVLIVIPVWTRSMSACFPL